MFTSIGVDDNGTIVSMDYDNEGTSEVHFWNSNSGEEIMIASEPDAGSYLYETNKTGTYNVIGQKFLRDVSTAGTEHLNVAWSFYPSDAPLWASGKDLDYKAHYPKGIGVMFGTAMTSRDAGNALWGGWTRNMYHLSLPTMTKISNQVAGGREDARSYSMQKWGWEKRFGKNN